jgi:hypothetical protein
LAARAANPLASLARFDSPLTLISHQEELGANPNLNYSPQQLISMWIARAGNSSKIFEDDVVMDDDSFDSPKKVNSSNYSHDSVSVNPNKINPVFKAFEVWAKFSDLHQQEKATLFIFTWSEIFNRCDG